MAIGAGVCYGGYDLELGTLRDPGSGFMFFWVGIIMMGLSLAILIRAMREKAKAGERETHLVRSPVEEDRFGDHCSFLLCLCLPDSSGSILCTTLAPDLSI